MKQRIEPQISYIICDNKSCNFKDDVKFEDYASWLNKPCPLCGDNLLTEEDHQNVLILTGAAKIINSLSDDEYRAIAVVDESDDKRVIASFSTHKGITLKSIEDC